MTQPTPTDSGEERKLRALLDRAARELRETNERRKEDGSPRSAVIDQLLKEIATPPQPSADEKQETPEAKKLGDPGYFGPHDGGMMLLSAPQPDAAGTPETDAEEARIRKEGGWGVDTDEALTFARSLERRLRAATARGEAAEKERDQARAEVKSLQEELGLKLAACDCAAMLDTESTHGGNREVVRGNPAWSPAFESVMRRTAECLALRADLATLKARCEGLEKERESWAKLASAMDNRHCNVLAPQLAALEEQVGKLESDRERLEKVRLKALENVGFHVNAIPTAEIENKRLEHSAVLAAHRILSTGNPGAGVIDAARQSAGSGEESGTEGGRQG